jgi:hypothetical protein
MNRYVLGVGLEERRAYSRTAGGRLAAEGYQGLLDQLGI